MKNVRKICLTLAGLLLLVSCEDRSEDFFNSEYSESLTSSNSTINQEQLTPIILGEKLENPFSVENMQKALNSLLEESNELEGTGISKRNAAMLTISPTDWYICSKVDSTQFNTLISDTTLTLSQVPLDCEIIQHGDYLEDFQNSEIKNLYTVVKPGYTNPNGIDFEILDEIFIPENSEYYYDEDNEDVIEKRSLSANSFNDNFVNLLLKKAFINTDNERFLANTSQLEKRQLIQGKKTSYYPEGKISYRTPKGYEPVKGIKIVMWRWFRRIEAITDENGHFKSKTKLNKILIGNNVQYYMNMTGQNGDQKWHLDTNLFGVLCFWVNEYSLGSGSPNYVDFKFDTIHKAWRQCLVNNAIYDYVTHTRKEGLTLPPNELRIAVGNNGIASSAPLFTKYFSADFEILFGLADALITDGIVAPTLRVSPLPIPTLTLLKPDIIINCSNTTFEYYRRYSAVWHELNHGAHLQAMINEKGKDFATKYWTTIVRQEASNYTKTKDSYGEKGDKNWEYIALAEGWANYRQWKMSKQYLKYNSITKVSYEPTSDNKTYNLSPKNFINRIYYRYSGLFVDLNGIYSDKEIENAISKNQSIGSFNKYIIENLEILEKLDYVKKKLNYYETTNF
jgi:hypothetical protein